MVEEIRRTKIKEEMQQDKEEQEDEHDTYSIS